jgi:hypothetical protein
MLKPMKGMIFMTVSSLYTVKVEQVGLVYGLQNDAHSIHLCRMSILLYPDVLAILT